MSLSDVGLTLSFTDYRPATAVADFNQPVTFAPNSSDKYGATTNAIQTAPVAADTVSTTSAAAPSNILWTFSGSLPYVAAALAVLIVGFFYVKFRK